MAAARAKAYDKAAGFGSEVGGVLRRPAGASGSPPPAGGLLANVTVYALGLARAEEDQLTQVVPAFGGTVVFNSQEASHTVVPTHMSTIAWNRLRPEIENRLSAGANVVNFEWLEGVIESGVTSPWDKEFCGNYVPAFVQGVICDLADRRSFGAAASAATLARSQREQEELEIAQALTAAAPRSFAPCAGSSPVRPAAASPAAASRGQQPQPPLAFETSLLETWQYLRKERPADLEESELQCAIERSLLDCALQLQSRARGKDKTPMENPEKVLGVDQTASQDEVKAAYREKVRTAHPDKGGDPREFCRIRRAYLALSQPRAALAAGAAEDGEAPLLLALTQHAAACKDVELRDHRALVRAKFEEDGVDLSDCVARQQRALKELGLTVRDVGATNRNEQGSLMYNQCFYLSLACSLNGANADKPPTEDEIKQTGLLLKRMIEAGVLSAHPDWAGSRVGEDVQAFSDFLFFVLGDQSMLSEFSVAVFDSVSGCVEIYQGRAYGEQDLEDQRTNLLAVYYVPGHYQALVASRKRPSTGDLEKRLDACGVRYVTTNV